MSLESSKIFFYKNLLVNIFFQGKGYFDSLSLVTHYKFFKNYKKRSWVEDKTLNRGVPKNNHNGGGFLAFVFLTFQLFGTMS